MLAVIADDLTGAAELGGIGLRYGFRVEIGMEVPQSTRADLLVISTDTRSMPESGASKTVTKVSTALLDLQPELIYKKTDSVLRGHVMAETLAQLQVTGQPKALIVPANPMLGRTLTNGQYFLNGVPIHQTHFAQDPEFPILDSSVLSMVRADAAQASVRPNTAGTPANGIVIGEVTNVADLQAWTRWINPDTLLGGAAGFFTEILNALGYQTKADVAGLQPLSTSRLYVCGTAYGRSVELIRQARRAGKAVSYMPPTLSTSESQDSLELANWATEVGELLHKHKQVIMAIDPDTVSSETANAVWLRTAMAASVKSVIDVTPVGELIIEGGSTASAVLRAIDVTRLVPVQEFGPGVVRSRAVAQPTLHITVKPGSYAWGSGLWILDNLTFFENVFFE